MRRTIIAHTPARLSSALRIARLLPKGGHLYSIEIDALNAAIATKIIEFAGLRDSVTFIVGVVETKAESLKSKYGLDHVDLVFLDHEKVSRTAAL